MSPHRAEFRRSGHPCNHKPLARCNDRLSSRSAEVKLVIMALSREVKRTTLPVRPHVRLPQRVTIATSAPWARISRYISYWTIKKGVGTVSEKSIWLCLSQSAKPTRLTKRLLDPSITCPSSVMHVLIHVSWLQRRRRVQKKLASPHSGFELRCCPLLLRLSLV